ncbi:hypothetical protein [Brachybacterium fresconis]|uniref:Uncharacterized protein n=1 Tax=Brachybacterium fresconis TaxID=173363 RepID=A0ABS4YQ83_9MICO|nr:hypothetical protein [Brachybacterium fresconis]MBP2410962.1 hypothetical protein [Brachybacterium fresconis]
MFLRFQSAVPNSRGTYPGIFAMTNGLRDSGLLTEDDAEWVRRQNAHGNRAYTDPSTVAAECYSTTVNPGARSWFKDDALALLQMARRYTVLLNKYEVPWVELRTERPGRIVYDDAVQVVAVPYVHEEHWPLRTGDHRPSSTRPS